MCHFDPSCRSRKHHQYYHIYLTCSEARADLPCQSITLGSLPRVPAPNRCPECIAPVAAQVCPRIVEDVPRTLSELLRIYLNAKTKLDDSWKGERISFADEEILGPATLLRVWKSTAEIPFMGAEIPGVALGLDWNFKRESFDARNEEVPLTSAEFIEKEAIDLFDLLEEEAVIMANAHDKEIQDAALRNEREERAESDLQYFLCNATLQSVRQHCQDTPRDLTLEIID